METLLELERGPHSLLFYVLVFGMDSRDLVVFPSCYGVRCGFGTPSIIQELSSTRRSETHRDRNLPLPFGKPPLFITSPVLLRWLPVFTVFFATMWTKTKIGYQVHKGVETFKTIRPAVCRDYVYVAFVLSREYTYHHFRTVPQRPLDEKKRRWQPH